MLSLWKCVRVRVRVGVGVCVCVSVCVCDCVCVFFYFSQFCSNLFCFFGVEGECGKGDGCFVDCLFSSTLPYCRHPNTS